MEFIARSNSRSVEQGHLEGEVLNEYSETIRKRQGPDGGEFKEGYSGFRDMSGIGDMSGLGDISGLGEMSGNLEERKDNNENNKDISEIRERSVYGEAVPFDYLGGAANAEDREFFLDRGQKLGFLDLCREDFRRNVGVLSGFWMVQGISLYMYTHSGSVGGESYDQMLALVGLSIVGFSLACVMCLFLKTKRALMILCMISGVFLGCQGILIFKNEESSASFAIGIIANSAVQGLLMMYSIEIMPTSARSIGIGCMQFVYLIGIICGYVSIPYAAVILCTTASVSMLYPIMLYKLPETGHLPLTDFALLIHSNALP